VKRHTRPTGAVRISAKDTGIKYSDRCTHTCPYRLARLGTSPEFGGSERPRKKKFIFYMGKIKKQGNDSHKKAVLAGLKK